VYFGSGLRFWLHRLLFLDSLSYLSHGQLSLSLNRTFLVDIDDIFVGERGTRLLPDDVRVRWNRLTQYTKSLLCLGVGDTTPRDELLKQVKLIRI
jgi:heparan sulfate-N-deacetylase.